MTPAEKILWKRLRKHNIMGVKFRRQHPIEFYVADFYCHEARLVIEVDGPFHDESLQRSHDECRTAEIERFDIKVIRFTNLEVKNHIGKVLHRIRTEINERTATRR